LIDSSSLAARSAMAPPDSNLAIPIVL
jgi:hypothetical protein